MDANIDHNVDGQEPQHGFVKRHRKKVVAGTLAGILASGGLAWAIFTYYADVSGVITGGEPDRNVATSWSNPRTTYELNVGNCSGEIREDGDEDGDSLRVLIAKAEPDPECQVAADLTLDTDADQEYTIVGYGSQLPDGWTVTMRNGQGKTLAPGDTATVGLNFSGPEQTTALTDAQLGAIGPGGVKLQPAAETTSS